MGAFAWDQRYELPGLCRFRFRFLHDIQSVVSRNFLSLCIYIVDVVCRVGLDEERA